MEILREEFQKKSSLERGIFLRQGFCTWKFEGKSFRVVFKVGFFLVRGSVHGNMNNERKGFQKKKKRFSA